MRSYVYNSQNYLYEVSNGSMTITDGEGDQTTFKKCSGLTIE